MNIHHERTFEDEICQHLAGHGWLYADGDAARYEAGRALFPDDVLAWVRQSQPAAWTTLERDHGAGAGVLLLGRVRASLDARGTLDVLRRGVDVVGLRRAVDMAQFRPAFNVNAEVLARYDANRLRVVRQVRYSVASGNSLDLVLFLNGLPVATAELKTDFTQTVEDAVDQYRFHRDPKPKGRAAEPLLAFPGGAVVHFAVSNSEVKMATKLEGADSRFLPFNQGDDGAAGNPPNPAGHRTAYLWEGVWERHGWLEILGRYMVGRRNPRRQLTGYVFPRYHQLDGTRKLRAAVLARGAGGTYLIQHSAGSGKTNSIAWAAHFLADLHDAGDQKVFSSVLVVSDRTVIDDQLQEAVFEFERTTGVVPVVKGEGTSKTNELAAALAGGKKIVVCTIQTFPFALRKVRELAATEGKRFAVIADEAHSSQAGQAAIKMGEVLSPAEMAELNDGGEVGVEDVLAAMMKARASDGGVTYVAFTATPKAKTMELFGTLPDPTRPPATDNVPVPFHVYSMRQAIEEGFILDVLRNYTSYKLAFRLAYGGKEWDDKEVERHAAMKGVMGWVQLHPYNISQKVQLIVEHYRERVAPLLGGTAKAMVVVDSRKEAVRWQLALRKYIAERGYRIGTLVGFSGEVDDPEAGPDPFTESSVALNPTLRGRNLREAFNTDEFQTLLAANKFQTGFDQPLLCGMYVHKRLAGIQAVQTLSRLNRAHPGKDTTYVVDFVNEPADILAEFKKYHTTAELEDVSNPHVVYALRDKLDAGGHYGTDDVDRVVAVAMKPDASQGALDAAVSPVQQRLMQQFKAARERWKAATAADDEEAAKVADDEMESLLLFEADTKTFLRVYTFLSQVFDYGNTDLEKRAIFFRYLLPQLKFGRERDAVDVSKLVLTHHNVNGQGRANLSLAGGETPKLKPMTEVGSGQVQEKEKAFLREIIKRVNGLFEGVTDQDALVYVNDVIKGKLMESGTLVQQAASNTPEQFAASPDLDAALSGAIIGALDAHTAMSTQALNSPNVMSGLKDILLNVAGLYEALRGASGGHPAG